VASEDSNLIPYEEHTQRSQAFTTRPTLVGYNIRYLIGKWRSIMFQSTTVQFVNLENK
jgi:hypothetical protein